MAIPTFVAAGTQAQTANGGGSGPVVPGLPAGLAANDILILFVETSNEPLATTTGYANVGVGTVVQATGLVTALTVRWKRAVGGETAPSVSLAAAGNHVIARLVAFRGCVAAGTPFEAVQTNTDNTTSTAFTVPGGTTLGTDRLVIASAATGTDTTSTTMATGWTNASLASPAVTETLDNWHVTGNGGGFAVARGGKAAAGAYNATTGTLTTGNTKALMSFALIGAGAVTNFNGTSTLTVTNTRTATGQARGAGSLTGTATFTATGVVQPQGTASLTETAVITTAGATQNTTGVTATATITAVGSLGGGGSSGAAFSTVTVTSTATGQTRTTGSFTETATITAAGLTQNTATRSITATVTAIGAVQVSATRSITATITSTGVLAIAASRIQNVSVTALGAVTVSGVSVLTVAATVTAVGLVDTGEDPVFYDGKISGGVVTGPRVTGGVYGRTFVLGGGR